MNLYIVVTQRFPEEVTMAIHAENEDQAKELAGQRYIGWKIVLCKLDNSPKVLQLYRGRIGDTGQ